MERVNVRYEGKLGNLQAYLQECQLKLTPKGQVLMVEEDKVGRSDMGFYEQKQRFYEYATGEPRDEELENSAWGDDGHEEWVLNQDE